MMPRRATLASVVNNLERRWVFFENMIDLPRRNFIKTKVCDKVPEGYRLPLFLEFPLGGLSERKPPCQKPSRSVQPFRFNTGLWYKYKHDDSVYRANIASRGKKYGVYCIGCFIIEAGNKPGHCTGQLWGKIWCLRLHWIVLGRIVCGPSLQTSHVLWSVCSCIGHPAIPAETAEPIEGAVWSMDSLRPRNHMDARISARDGALRGSYTGVRQRSIFFTLFARSRSTASDYH